MINQLLDKLSPFRSVRARFSIAMGVSGIVFGMALTSFMEWHLESGLRTSAQDSLNATADAIAYKLVEDLTNRQREISLIANLIGSNQIIHPQALREVIDGLKQHQPVYAWIGLTDTHGKVTAASGGLLEGQDVSERPWFIGGMKDVFLSDPHAAKLLAQYMPPKAGGEPPRFLDVAVPVQDRNNAPQGVLAAHLFWDWVQDVVSTTVAKGRKDNPIEVLIADRTGTWMLRLNTDKSTPVHDLNVDASDAKYLTATQKVITKTPSDALGWTVLVREETRFAFAPIDQSRKLMLSFTALLAALFTLASWLISGRIVRPIIQLADAAKSHTGARAAGPSPIKRKIQDETGVLGQAIDQLAHYDGLTGLFNRSEFLVRLNQAIDRAAARHTHCALLLINLDNFNLLNNTKGHDIGDQLLIAVAHRLHDLEDTRAVLSRLGGDEFVVLLEALDPDASLAEASALALAKRALAKFQMPFELNQGAYLCQASVGIALIGNEAINMDDALKRSELAMLEAKKRGKNQAVMFDRGMQEALDERVQFEAELRAAIPEQLFVCYQPQVDQHGAVFGAELLIRWRHPVKGLISPAKFIPVAEETGLILPIGQWVLEAACRQIKAWEEDPLKNHLVLAVNVSAKEFSEPGYVDGVQRILSTTSANPFRLKLELTESALAEDIDEVVRKMQALKTRGISFSLDDFGTGFSSLSYLTRMPLDQLKIDQSFVRHATDNASDAAIVRTVIALGQSLGLMVIAEGVESQTQRDFLALQGCDYYQGYLFGRPAPVAEFESSLTH